MSGLSDAIVSIFQDCFKLNRNEKVLILADEPFSHLGWEFYNKATALTRSPYLMILPKISNNGYEPPKSIASVMGSSDVILLLTTRSLSHTQARRKANQNGARIASFPGITPEILLRNMDGNYQAIVSRSRKLADILTIGRSAYLKTPAGTDLSFSISRMKGYADTGMLHEKGQFSNLPAGEACVAPVAASVQGTMIIDGSFPNIGKIKTPVRMNVKDGQIIRILGGEEAVKIRSLLRPFGKDARMIGEIGIGTNPKAKLTGCILEDEKVLGMVHIALGNNISFGGKNSVRCHYDSVLLKPTLEIDGKTIIDNGELQV
jgi:leucyl aminopeptidase (aminopeptidase T)